MSVTEKAISKRLEILNMIVKEENRVFHELKSKDVEQSLLDLNSCFKNKKS